MRRKSGWYWVKGAPSQIFEYIPAYWSSYYRQWWAMRSSDKLTFGWVRKVGRPIKEPHE